MIRRVWTLFVTAAVLAGCATTTSPQPSVAVYPAKGQSAQQQQNDTGECVAWAKEQTGYDPVKETAIGAGIGAAIGAVAGAATGAAVGAATGSGAGKGAAVGAVVGGVGGAATGGGYQYAKTKEGYEKAFGACMSGRGYSVR